MNLFVLTIMTILGHTVDFPNCFSSEVNPKLHAKIITDSAFFSGQAIGTSDTRTCSRVPKSAKSFAKCQKWMPEYQNRIFHGRKSVFREPISGFLDQNREFPGAIGMLDGLDAEFRNGFPEL